MRTEDRSEILSRKGEEFQVNLEQWARENALLAHNEIMEVSLTVAIHHRPLPPLQFTFTEEIPLRQISVYSLAALERIGGKPLRPAILTNEEAEILLSRLSGQAKESLEQFFMDTSSFNRSERISSMPRIHKACKKPINGKYYRLMKLKSGIAEIWEVQLKPG